MARILVVEDDVSLLEALGKFLEKRQYQVDCVLNGRDALQHIMLRAPDLIILDLFLPEIDGWRLLEIIRSYSQLQRVPVVVFTALTDSPMLEHVRGLNVSRILTKTKATLEDIAQAAQSEL